jgi:hypothetical protein
MGLLRATASRTCLLTPRLQIAEPTSNPHRSGRLPCRQYDEGRRGSHHSPAASEWAESPHCPLAADVRQSGASLLRSAAELLDDQRSEHPGRIAGRLAVGRLLAEAGQKRPAAAAADRAVAVRPAVGLAPSAAQGSGLAAGQISAGPGSVGSDRPMWPPMFQRPGWLHNCSQPSILLASWSRRYKPGLHWCYRQH